MTTTPDQAIARDFWIAGYALSRILCNEFDHSDSVKVKYLALTLRELQTGSFMGRTVDFGTSPIVAIVDEAVRTYLQASPLGDTKSRLDWLAKKATEAHAYLHFLEAREQFMESLRSKQSLTAVAGRLQGETVEVEAGKYSLRDLQNVVIRLEDKLNSFRSQQATPV